MHFPPQVFDPEVGTDVHPSVAGRPSALLPSAFPSSLDFMAFSGRDPRGEAEGAKEPLLMRMLRALEDAAAGGAAMPDRSGGTHSPLAMEATLGGAAGLGLASARQSSGAGADVRQSVDLGGGLSAALHGAPPPETHREEDFPTMPPVVIPTSLGPLKKPVVPRPQAK